MNSFLDACRNIVGADHVLTDQNMAAFLTDWSKCHTGSAQAVIRPVSIDEVVAIVRLCVEYLVPIVPQGGNTGRVIGGVPDTQGNAIVLSLMRFNRIREIDVMNRTMTVESGCTLDNVRHAAAESGLIFPLSMASSGSCTIGGNLSSNAGGIAGLRYGNARELCLGLEVVTPQGEVWNGLRKLRKNNSGYDLRDLYIGSEGTLGIITAAVIKLFPQPRTRITAFVGLNSPECAQRLLMIVRKHCDAALTGFELISEFSLQLATKHFPKLFMPLSFGHHQYVLLELSDTEPEEHLMSLLETVIGDAILQDVVQDAAIASSISQEKAMWELYGHIFPAQNMEGSNVKHDIAVPTSHVAEFIASTDALLQKRFPGCRIVTFGHLGDGSLHYNVFLPDNLSEYFLQLQNDINQIVYDSVDRYDGSISPEYGIGSLKVGDLAIHKHVIEISMMRNLKQAIDPYNLMNPGESIQDVNSC